MSLYRITLPELKEFQKQSMKLLNAGFVKPLKILFDTQVLFQWKHYRSLRICIDSWAQNKVKMKNWYTIPFIDV